ncbi:helix-turn-helix transcriptional regulator [Chitinophaga nivalis]|uniref:AraC family transcriptional regulator n=1 Tax=Chitinophaga nivalis TaxID=2991709 RepID=A0ABT3IRM5_9BACT|nr:AraC family transcriptional regulator [Chitinophaga nivalis]MCW3463691.1 AraC family transcriptional regulator [Chitinophaga nivalis]MCW3486619.1 AraC family transcriptional regulator [Chitinophaga nivalis]
MILEIESVKPQGIIFNDDFNIHEENDIVEIDRISYAAGVKDTNKVIKVDEIYLYYVNIDSEQGIDYRVYTDTPSLQLMFNLCANFLFAMEKGTTPDINFQFNQHNIICFPRLNSYSSWAPGNNQEYIEIILPLAFFRKYIPLQKVFNHFHSQLEREQIATLSQYNMPVTPAMRNILQEIIHNQRTGSYKKMLIEARIIELLMLQLEQYEMLSQNPVCTGLRKSEIDRMHEAKDIILHNLTNPCSLIDLAHQIGTNEFNLKKSFKKVFGTTVFGYLNQVKMEEARKLLLSQEHNVNQVAAMMGYNDATNFSAAFKKHFGILPSKLR